MLAVCFLTVQFVIFNITDNDVFSKSYRNIYILRRNPSMYYNLFRA